VTALVEVVNDPAERERRGRAARRAVCEEFSWTTIAEQLSIVLDEVVASIRPTTPRMIPSHVEWDLALGTDGDSELAASVPAGDV
jgi:hypothetical protein